jgi:uncharacterized protein YigE (DUF2233 family)
MHSGQVAFMSWSIVKKSLFALTGLLLWPTLVLAEFQSLQPGLEYQELALHQGTTSLHLLRVDLKKYSIKPIDGRNLGKASLTVKEMAQKKGAIAVINANFFDPDKKPLGLVLLDGKIKNAFHPTSWWASFLIKGTQAKITKVFSPAKVKGYQQGIQAGPRLIVNGRPPKLKKEASPKSAIGIDPQGRVLLIATSSPMEIGALADILARPKKKGGLGLTQALNLDGGSSTQFFLKTADKEVYLPGMTKVPVGLGIFSKS